MGMEKDKPMKIGQNTLLIYVLVSLRQGFGCRFPIIGFCVEGCWRDLKCFGCVNLEHTNVLPSLSSILMLVLFLWWRAINKVIVMKMLKGPQLYWLCQLWACKSMASTIPTFVLWLFITQGNQQSHCHEAC